MAYPPTRRYPSPALSNTCVSWLPNNCLLPDRTALCLSATKPHLRLYHPNTRQVRVFTVRQAHHAPKNMGCQPLVPRQGGPHRVYIKNGTKGTGVEEGSTACQLQLVYANCRLHYAPVPSIVVDRRVRPLIAPGPWGGIDLRRYHGH